MDQPFTSSLWKVVGGREEDFIAACQSFKDYAEVAFPGEPASVLRDHDDPSLFVILRRWSNQAEIDRFRADPERARFIEKLTSMVDETRPAQTWTEVTLSTTANA